MALLVAQHGAENGAESGTAKVSCRRKSGVAGRGRSKYGSRYRSQAKSRPAGQLDPVNDHTDAAASKERCKVKPSTPSQTVAKLTGSCNRQGHPAAADLPPSAHYDYGVHNATPHRFVFSTIS